jgi:hypothetical protein
MPNRYNSDVNNAKGEKNTKKDAEYPSGKAISDKAKNFSEGSHKLGGAPSGKGGKDLPCPTFKEQSHTEPSGQLPKNGK